MKRRGFIKFLGIVLAGWNMFFPRLAHAGNAGLFATGSADDITQAIVGAMGEPTGDNVMWFWRTAGLVYSMAAPLTELRDRGEIVLSSEVFQEYGGCGRTETDVVFSRMMGLAARGDLSARSREMVRLYFDQLPGFVWGVVPSRHTAREAHRYLLMQMNVGLEKLAAKVL